MRTVVKEIASVKNNVEEVEKLLFKVNKDFQLPDLEFGNLVIAVSEIVMNAIVHGNKLDEKKRVKMSIDYDDEQMIIKIEDEGNGFDFNKKRDPTIEENLHKTSGRGLFIVKSLMGNIEYKKTGKGTEIILTINKK